MSDLRPFDEDDKRVLEALRGGMDEAFAEADRQVFGITAVDTGQQKSVSYEELLEIWKTMPQRPRLELSLLRSVADWSDQALEKLIGMLPLLKGAAEMEIRFEQKVEGLQNDQGNADHGTYPETGSATLR